MPFSVLLTDIEGTVTSISFVKDELFPYAFSHVSPFLSSHYDRPEVQTVVADLIALSKEQHQNDHEVKVVDASSDKDTVVAALTENVQRWIRQDKKLTAMKTLQGLIWEEAYRNGDVKGHLYDDVLPVLEALHARNIPLYIYSSGSVHAQKLLFGHWRHGDVTKILSGYFDTRVGLKGESGSYSHICDQIGCRPEEVLFVPH